MRNKRGNRTSWMIGAVLALAGLLACVMPQGYEPAQAESHSQILELGGGDGSGRIDIVVGRSATYRLGDSFSQIVVGDPETADVNPLTDKTLYVLGRKIGTTNISFFDADKQLIGVVDVEVTLDLSALREDLKQNIPGNRIKVRSINGRILLAGEVPSAPAAEKAMTLARYYGGEDVTNSLTVADLQQVNLEVRLVEVNRSAGKELGINWNLTDKNLNGIVTGNNPPNVPPGFVPYIPFATIVANILSNGTSPDLLINALEERRVARRLAEPNLTALSGQPASFHAGGEVPIRDCTDDDGDGERNCSIIYKEFGVRLGFTPTVLDSGLINLSITPEVSEIDSELTNFQTGFAFVTRKAQTSVELHDGQSFAIAGLLQNNNTRTKQQLPWLGDVPVLGTLFRSSSFQKRESDLVIIVTPRLVRPVGTDQHLRTPLQNTLSSNEPELFLLGKLEVSRRDLDLKYRGQYGHIIDLPKVDYGEPQK